MGYLEATCFDSFRGAFVCNTRTRWRPLRVSIAMSTEKCAYQGLSPAIPEQRCRWRWRFKQRGGRFPCGRIQTWATRDI